MTRIPVHEHLLMRTYEESDAAELFDTVNGSRAHLGPWLGWVAGTTKPEHSLQFIRLAHNDIQEQRALALGMFQDGVLAGGIGMHKWDHETRIAQVGYWLGKGFEGKGIVGQCLEALTTYLFDTVGLNKIEIHFVTANQRSARVAERLGCKVEGIIRQSFVRNGMVEDLVVTGILKGEWKTRQRKA